MVCDAAAGQAAQSGTRPSGRPVARPRGTSGRLVLSNRDDAADPSSDVMKRHHRSRHHGRRHDRDRGRRHGARRDTRHSGGRGGGQGHAIVRVHGASNNAGIQNSLETGTPGGSLRRRAPSLERRTYDVALAKTRGSVTAYLAVTAGLLVLNAQGLASWSRVGGLLLPDSGNGLTLVGRRLYLAQGVYGLVAVDVSKPHWPKLLSRVALAGAAQDVVVEGRKAYVAAGGAGLVVVDVHRPAHMKVLGRIATGGYAWSVVVKGRKAYVAAGRAGMVVVDVHRPARMKVLSKMALGGEARSVALVRDSLLVAGAGSGGLVLVQMGRGGRTGRVVGRISSADFTRGVAAWGDWVAAADGQGGVMAARIDRKAHLGKPVRLRTKLAANKVSLVRWKGKTLLVVANDSAGLLVLSTALDGKPTRLGGWPKAR